MWQWILTSIFFLVLATVGILLTLGDRISMWLTLRRIARDHKKREAEREARNALPYSDETADERDRAIAKEVRSWGGNW